MLANKITESRSNQPVSESEILGQILSGPNNAVEIGKSLPEMQRARIAQFCYNRVHMRELGLRLASTCGIVALKHAFGRAADVVYEQSRDVDETLGKLKNTPGNQSPKPITLKGTITN
ncbi:MAG: hypothetical protein AAGA76_16285 [Pseudomonadota bacterium]